MKGIARRAWNIWLWLEYRAAMAALALAAMACWFLLIVREGIRPGAGVWALSAVLAGVVGALAWAGRPVVPWRFPDRVQ